MKSELRHFLEDEFAALAEPMREMEREARDFWKHPGEPALAVWAQFPVVNEIPDPPDGSVSERHLYYQLMERIKPALESRQYGFDTVPLIHGHGKYYTGPTVGPHVLAGIMGAEPRHTTLGTHAGWVPLAGTKPLISEVDEIDSLEDIDVSQSPLLQAVVRGFEEMAEIVQGSVPFAHYSPTLSLGLTADVFGLTKFFELTALDPEAALKLADVCGRKWLEMMHLEEQAVAGRWANHEYQPGIIMGAWDDELSPTVHRSVIIPHFQQMAEAYGGIFVHLGLADASLLRDYLQLPGLCGFSLKQDWPTEPVVDALQGTGVLQAAFNYHFHGGQKLETPVALPWEDCCRHLERFAGKLRVMALVKHHAPTPEKRKEGILRDLEDLKRVWEHVA